MYPNVRDKIIPSGFGDASVKRKIGFEKRVDDVLYSIAKVARSPLAASVRLELRPTGAAASS